MAPESVLPFLAALLPDLVRAVGIDVEGKVQTVFGDAKVWREDAVSRAIYVLNRSGSDCRQEIIVSLADGETARLRKIPVAGANAYVIERLKKDDFEFVVENLRQGVWRLDHEGCIISVNRYLAQWLETTEEALIGTAASRWRRGTFQGHRYETEFITISGRRRPALVARMTHPSYGAALEVVTDISGQDWANEALLEEVKRMSHLARTDVLTGLPNRLVFDEWLRQLRASGRPFAVFLIDLDRLKEINDSRGHVAGDEALIDVARRLRETVRAGDLVARLGGDEFAILLPDTERPAAEHTLVRLKARMAVAGGTGGALASVGMAHSDEGSEEVLHLADARMYRHKRERNRIR